MINDLSHLYDEKAESHSILVTVPLKWYLDLVEGVYNSGGGIDGQRTALSTKTGRRIRSQMVEDFKNGGILPPIVIGVEIDEFGSFSKENFGDFEELIKNTPEDNISILDGMQRTTAMIEAVSSSNEGELDARMVRVEFWIAQKLHSLLYRMLVLNTGQVPWSLRRQVEVVFHSLKKEMKSQVSNLNIVEVDEGQRRTNPGVFQADKLIEIFLILGTRSERLDVKEKLADEFLRLDFIENASDKPLTDVYFKLLQIIVNFDLAISRENLIHCEGRFSKGVDLLSSKPALVGFVVAFSQFVFGRPGQNKHLDDQNKALKKCIIGFECLIKRLERMDSDELVGFCALPVLNEQISIYSKGSKIGDEERSFFKNAFKVILEENFDLQSLEVCWRA